MSARLSVLKLGGSVLRDDASYGKAARFLQTRLALNQDERLVVIVSAQYGTTDALQGATGVAASAFPAILEPEQAEAHR